MELYRCAKRASYLILDPKQAPEQKSREEPQEYLDRIAGRELFRACVTGGDSEVNLPVLTLDQLYARVVQAVEG